MSGRIDALLGKLRRPSRCLGSEWNAARPRGRGDLLLASPSTYEQSALAPWMNAVYQACLRAGLRVERAYMPDPELEALLDAEGLARFSWETRRPVDSFERVLGIGGDRDGFGWLPVRFEASPSWEPIEAGGARLEPDPAEPRFVVPYASCAQERQVLRPSSEPEAAVRAALKATGLERIRIEGRDGWAPSKDLQHLLIEAGAKLEAGGRAYPDRAVRAAFPLPERASRVRIRMRLERGPEVRWVSHLEQAKTLRRALRRAGLPLALAQSRRADPKISFGPALAAGQESRSEYLDVELWRRTPPEAAAGALAAQLPAGFRVAGAKRVPLHYPSVEALATTADFIVRGALRSPGPAPDAVLGWDETEDGLRVRARLGSKIEPILEAWLGASPRGLQVRRERLWVETPSGDAIEP